MRKLAPRTRDLVPGTLVLAREVRDRIHRGDFDRADALDPGLSEARRYADRLCEWLEEIEYLVETEHS